MFKSIHNECDTSFPRTLFFLFLRCGVSFQPQPDLPEAITTFKKQLEHLFQETQPLKL